MPSHDAVKCQKMSQNKFNVFSLFSGAGGMDLGFMLTNKFKILLANDILPDPAETYTENFHYKIINPNKILPGVKLPIYILGNIAEVDFEFFKNENPDVVIGGPPCQDFSIVRGYGRDKHGIKVNRGRLYSHFISVLVHTQPKIFVFENVPGLRSANKMSAYKVIKDDFLKLKIRWKEIRNILGNSFTNDFKNYVLIFSDVVNSACLGVPQKRKRLIVIGVREDLLENEQQIKDLKMKAGNLLLDEGSLLRKYPLTTLEAFEGLPLSELNHEYKKIMKEYEGIADAVGTQKALDWEQNTWENLSFDVVEDYFRVNDIQSSFSKEIDGALEEHVKILKKLRYYKERIEEKYFDDGSNNPQNESEDVRDRQKMIPPDENCLYVKGTKWEVEGRGRSLIYRRIHPLKPSYTVMAYGGGGTWGYHYRRGRSKLTNRERARLQSFPDSFTFSGNTAKVRAQIGEAVPPLLGEKIADLADAVLKNI